MGGLTPLECFLAGVAVVSTGSAFLLFLALVSVGKKVRAERDERMQGDIADLDGRGPEGRRASAADQRLREIEKRLSALESQVRQVTT